MKRLLSILFLLVSVLFPCLGQPIYPLTTNTMFIKDYDSFDVAEFGNRWSCYDEGSRILYSPEVIARVRTISRSGDDDHGGLTNRESALGAPLAGAMHGTNDVIMQFFCSGNHVPPPLDSSGFNYTLTNMQTRLLFPTFTYTRDLRFTNDWPWSTNGIRKLVYSDAGYYGTNLVINALTYSLGGSNAAFLANVPFINRFAGSQFIITNYYPGNSNYWYSSSPGAFDHPGTVIQTAGVIKQLLAEGMETNIFTLVFNASALTVTQTNHCTFTGFSKTGNVLSGTFRPLRLGMPYDAADAQHTNDARPTFVLDPSCSNAFCEVMRFTGLAPGTHVFALNGLPVSTNITASGDVTLNFFHITQGPMWDKKMLVLDGCRNMRDVDTTNASDDVPFNKLLTEFGSQSVSGWATNRGVTEYTSVMLPYEQLMEVQDAINNSNAQPADITFSDTLVLPRFAPAHR